MAGEHHKKQPTAKKKPSITNGCAILPASTSGPKPFPWRWSAQDYTTADNILISGKLRRAAAISL